ncbi:MAG: hypothetical protein M1469_01655 [Bacteroidetes bacterium]|nr:hypothetical protein [Bacteroidota bacterium]
MNKGQEDRATMHKAVDTLLDANADKTAEIPAFEITKTNFKADVAELNGELLVYGNVAAGKTQVKWDAEDSLIFALLPIASALKVVAKREKDPELAEKASVTETSLRRLRDTELVTRGKLIHAEALKIVTELATFNITPEVLTGLSAKIEAYDKSIGGRESGVAQRKGARKAVSDLFAKVDDDLEDLDNLMELLREKHPGFYNEYQSARTIKDTGTRHRPPEPPPANQPAQK